MALEDMTGTTTGLNVLVPSNPDGLDPVSQGDNHIRGVKNVLLNTFGPMDSSAISLPAIGNTLQWNGTKYVPAIPVPGVPAGTILDYAGLSTNMPAGYLFAQGASLLVASYPALFAAIGYLYGGSGANFNIPDARSKTTVSSGGGSKNEQPVDTAFNASTDAMTIPSNTDKWITGDAINFYTLTGSGIVTNPAGLLNDGASVFCIRSGLTEIKFATTLANALAGVAIDIVSAGVGSYSIYSVFKNRAVGSVAGAETHAQTISELAAHDHTGAAVARNANDNSSPGYAMTGANTGMTGGGQAFSIMNPIIVVTKIIKT